MFSDLNTKAKIEYVKLGFQNSDSIIVPVKKIDDILILGIRAHLHYQNYVKDFMLSNSTRYECERAKLTIKYEDSTDLDYANDKGNLGRVMVSNDISHLTFLDKNEESIFCVDVPWGVSECYNDCMRVEVGEVNKKLHIYFFSSQKNLFEKVGFHRGEQN